MSNPTLSLERTINQKGYRLVVRNATPALREILDGLGMLPVVDMANCQAITCYTAAELDAARNPLMHLFDRSGNWIGSDAK